MVKSFSSSSLRESGCFRAYFERYELFYKSDKYIIDCEVQSMFNEYCNEKLQYFLHLYNFFLIIMSLAYMLNFVVIALSQHISILILFFAVQVKLNQDFIVIITMIRMRRFELGGGGGCGIELATEHWRF